VNALSLVPAKHPDLERRERRIATLREVADRLEQGENISFVLGWTDPGDEIWVTAWSPPHTTAYVLQRMIAWNLER
jgi:hypothetical protein